MWAVTNPVASQKIWSQLHSFAIFLPVEDFGRASCSSLSIAFPHDGSTSSAALAGGECPASAALRFHQIPKILLPKDSVHFSCLYPTE